MPRKPASPAIGSPPPTPVVNTCWPPGGPPGGGAPCRIWPWAPPGGPTCVDPTGPHAAAPDAGPAPYVNVLFGPGVPLTIVTGVAALAGGAGWGVGVAAGACACVFGAAAGGAGVFVGAGGAVVGTTVGTASVGTGVSVAKSPRASTLRVGTAAIVTPRLSLSSPPPQATSNSAPRQQTITGPSNRFTVHPPEFSESFPSGCFRNVRKVLKPHLSELEESPHAPSEATPVAKAGVHNVTQTAARRLGRGATPYTPGRCRRTARPAPRRQTPRRCSRA